MKTFLFTWNPNNWHWDDLPQSISEANSEGYHKEKWSCASFKKINIGDRVFLMRLGKAPKGIMGSGIVASEVFEAPHWDPKRAEKGDLIKRVEIAFDALSDSPIIPEEELKKKPLSKYNWFPQASGIVIDSDISNELEELWNKATGQSFSPLSKNEISSLKEGRRITRETTYYERNSDARKACIRKHGTNCCVCNFSFKNNFGEIGKGFIHVHHLIPISENKKEYTIDPQNDLRPVCPNCHAMLHKRVPPYSINELKEIISSNQRVDFTVETPVDEVEVMRTESHP